MKEYTEAEKDLRIIELRFAAILEEIQDAIMTEPFCEVCGKIEKLKETIVLHGIYAV